MFKNTKQLLMVNQLKFKKDFSKSNLTIKKPPINNLITIINTECKL